MRRDAGVVERGLPAQHFIAGRWVGPANGVMMDTFDPGSARAWHAVAADKADVQRPAVTIERIRGDIKYLASDQLQGRGIGTRGEEIFRQWRPDLGRACLFLMCKQVKW